MSIPSLGQKPAPSTEESQSEEKKQQSGTTSWYSNLIPNVVSPRNFSLSSSRVSGNTNSGSSKTQAFAKNRFQTSEPEKKSASTKKIPTISIQDRLQKDNFSELFQLAMEYRYGDMSKTKEMSESFGFAPIDTPQEKLQKMLETYSLLIKHSFPAELTNIFSILDPKNSPLETKELIPSLEALVVYFKMQNPFYSGENNELISQHKMYLNHLGQPFDSHFSQPKIVRRTEEIKEDLDLTPEKISSTLNIIKQISLQPLHQRLRTISLHAFMTALPKEYSYPGDCHTISEQLEHIKRNPEKILQWIKEQKGLKQLEIHSPFIDYIPEVFDTSSLVELRCNFTSLTHLPPNFDPPHLKVLDITRTLITTLPKAFKGQKLERIYASMSPFTGFNRAFQGRLRVLDLSMTPFRSFPAGFHWERLVVLNLSRSQFKEFPEKTNMRNLRELNLSTLKIKTFPHDFKTDNIKTLNLSWNESFEGFTRKTHFPRLTDLVIFGVGCRGSSFEKLVAPQIQHVHVSRFDNFRFKLPIELQQHLF
jgi:hypothetical protein